MANPINSKEIAFNGKLRTAVDGASIGPNDFQVLKNLRYTDTNVRGVQGHTKINTSALSSTAIRNGIHFRKDQPAESHVVVEAGGYCYDNTTAVPGTGNFGAALNDTAGDTTGRFAIAPTGMLARCTSNQSLLWGGTEYRAAALIDNPTTAQIYDYTELICNTTIADSTHSATIHGSGNTLSDSNTVLLLHADTNITIDSSFSGDKIVSAYGGAAISTAQKKFGAASGAFSGTGYLTVNDHADFDFSGRNWTIDFWIRSNNTVGTFDIYHQQTNSSNYLNINTTVSLVGGVYRQSFRMDLYVAGVGDTAIYSSTSSPTGVWHHVSVVQDDDIWYLFVNGSLVYAVVSSSTVPNYTSVVSIGGNGPNSNLLGYLDEFRVSNTARWTSAFTPPSGAYGSSYASTTYLGSILPIKGFKATVGTANTSSGTMSVAYWDGSGWVPVSSLSDATSGFESTGWVTFTSTVGSSKHREIEKSIAHWYRIIVSGAAATFTAVLTGITVDVPMQPIQDLWDGKDRPVGAFLKNKSSAFSDYSANVLENEVDSANTYTYADISSMASTDYVIAGFAEQAMGFNVSVVSEKGNTTASTMTVDYWDGSAWVPLTVHDGTIDGTKTMAKSGMVTWTPPAINAEFKQTGMSSKTKPNIGGVLGAVASGASPLATFSFYQQVIKNTKDSVINKEFPMYYYRVMFTGGLSANTWVYYVSGIPAPVDVRGYLFPMEHAGRLLLCNNVDGWANNVKYSSYRTANVFNGEDASDLYFGGDEGIVAGTSIYNRFGSTVTNLAVLCKRGETWILQGDDPEDWKQFKISSSIGCVAPQSMVAVNIPAKENTAGISANAAVWVSSRGVEMFNGGSITLVSGDIDDLFDPARSTYLGASTIATITGFYDASRSEYHMVVPGSYEYVFDFHRGKWFQIVRGTELYGGFPVADTSGYQHCYGYNNNGYVMCLEYGTTFDGTAIAHTLRTGDMAFPDGSIMEWSQVKWFNLIAKAKTLTDQNIAMVYYNDTGASSYGAKSITPLRSGYRVTNTVSHNYDKQTTFHGFQFSISTDDETIGFEPLYLGIRYTVYPREQS